MEAWATVFICAFHHAVDEYQDGGDLDKQKHICIALNQATDDELASISKGIDYNRERERLNKIYDVVPINANRIPEVPQGIMYGLV